VRGFKYVGVPDRGASPITMDGVSNSHWSIAQIERGNLEYLIYFGVLQFDSYYSYSISTAWTCCHCACIPILTLSFFCDPFVTELWFCTWAVFPGICRGKYQFHRSINIHKSYTCTMCIYICLHTHIIFTLWLLMINSFAGVRVHQVAQRVPWFEGRRMTPGLGMARMAR
jgi:hypothetical protein